MPKPDTIFQKLYDQIDGYNDEELVKTLGKLQNTVLKSIGDMSKEQIAKVLNILVGVVKNLAKNI